ncbi:MAG: hypothetical protein JWM68_5018 [Verrucomicrobiales bacterium]|nr:hypothetical protein [Verrucomicrobiales bacterium]
MLVWLGLPSEPVIDSGFGGELDDFRRKQGLPEPVLGVCCLLLGHFVSHVHATIQF